jgi:hypothetical protein
LTPQVKPTAAPTIAAGIQAATDADLGTLEPTTAGSADEQYQPESADSAANSDSPIDALRNVVSGVRDAIIDDPTLVNDVLSAAEQAATKEKPWLTPLSFGKAVERLVAAVPEVDELFSHEGGAGKFDFVGLLAEWPYEVTTSNPSTVAAHLLRDYVDASKLATYEPIPKAFRF